MSALSQFENDREQQAVGPDEDCSDYYEDQISAEQEEFQETWDAFAKMISDAHFEATLENAYRNMQRLRATRDSGAIFRANEVMRKAL